jgi:hypothetical protein
MPLVILHHLLNVSVQLANKRGFKKIVGFCYVFRNAVIALNIFLYEEFYAL